VRHLLAEIRPAWRRRLSEGSMAKLYPERETVDIAELIPGD
jgi:hypothetical protein